MLWLKRLALSALALLAGLALLEAGLHAAAFFVQRATRAGLPPGWLTGNLRVLCIGDSNTYGLYLERDEAYPPQLEVVWNARVEAPKLEVLNLGFPGTNSSRVVRDFPRLLDTFAPDLVILMVGVNDFWTEPFPVGESPAEEARHWLRRNSRIYRALYMLLRAGEARELVVTWEEPPDVSESGGERRLGSRFEVRYGAELVTF